MSVSVFAERLRNAMNSRGLKQVDLVHAAEHRGVKMGKSHISQYVLKWYLVWRKTWLGQDTM